MSFYCSMAKPQHPIYYVIIIISFLNGKYHISLSRLLLSIFPCRIDNFSLVAFFSLNSFQMYSCVYSSICSLSINPLIILLNCLFTCLFIYFYPNVIVNIWFSFFTPSALSSPSSSSYSYSSSLRVFLFSFLHNHLLSSLSI